jgi:hypothetical protein
MKNGSLICVKTPQELFSDYKLIEDTGLDVPEAVKLKRMLEEKGLEIEGMPFTADQTAEAIIKALKTRG